MTNEDIAKLRLDKSAGTGRRRLKIPKKWIVAAVAVALIAGAALLASNPSAEVEIVTVAKVYPSQSFTLLNASGYVVAQRKAAVASKATGRLEWLGVEEGSKVKRGEIIARLENRDVVAAKEQAEANVNTARFNLAEAGAELENAQLSLRRSQELSRRGFIAQADFDNAEARNKRAHAAVSGAEAALNAAQAALKAAEVAVEYTLIRAPFDAVVLTKNADIGDIVTPLGAAANAKAAVVTIADMSSLQVEVDVSESNLGGVKVGQPCEIQLDAIPDARFRGAVHMIVPTADRTKASVLVKVRFIDKDPRVLPEMSARVAFLERQVTKEEEAPRTGINPSAVVTKDGRQVVYVVQSDRAAETTVRTGGRVGDLIEVLEGVKPGDKVVLRPPKGLKDGSRVSRKER
jgi:RND family efflux transporter MFP subunit